MIHRRFRTWMYSFSAIDPRTAHLRPNRTCVASRLPPVAVRAVPLGPRQEQTLTHRRPDLPSVMMPAVGERERVRVLWVTKGLGPGGAERLLLSFAGGAAHDRFAFFAAYLLPWKDQLVD